MVTMEGKPAESPSAGDDSKETPQAESSALAANSERKDDEVAVSAPPEPPASLANSCEKELSGVNDDYVGVDADDNNSAAGVCAGFRQRSTEDECVSESKGGPNSDNQADTRSDSSNSSDREQPTVSHVTVSCVKHKVECCKCGTGKSLFWRTANDGGLLCVACVSSTNPISATNNPNGNGNGRSGEQMASKEDPEEDASQGGSESPATPMGSVDNEEGDDGQETEDGRGTRPPSPRKREVRKGTRMKTAKSVKSLVKSRRTVMFKRAPPTKTAPSVAHFITTPYVRHKGSYLQSGDIVSMLGDDGEIYYAQLRSFLVDQFGQLSTTISWLIPSERSPVDGSFDPASFVIGPEEDFPRELASMSFECHAPSDYYLSRSRPVLFDERKACKAFTWTALGQPRAIWEEKSGDGRHHFQAQQQQQSQQPSQQRD
ncbi:GATA zinc finger domain-containing protein 1-like [Tropilaelaps mercedesae]|uniref:GATA zinc finger domain-containing protein 1 n=1 Tax=Tropilaelaps mercedesae TaxID=418985 RepID=A0A1V9XEM1_9ACAR|nr:GATA zinc finger domain-containing protein 1-like [Tropilaelaps mercedesae]